MVSLAEKKIVVDGLIVTYYQSVIHQNSPNLVFLHGWASQSQFWYNWVNHLAKDFNLTFIDLPGFGKSEAFKNTAGLRDYAGLTSELIDKISIKSYFIVGHSFGGSIGIISAINHPDIVKGLILVDSAGVRPKTIKKQTIQTIAALVHPFFKPKFMQGLRKKIYQQIGSEDYVNATDTTRKIYQQIINEDLTLQLSQVKQPVLIIWGDQDQETPIANAKIMHNEIRNSELVIIPGAGHFAFVDNADLFETAIIKFMKERIK